MWITILDYYLIGVLVGLVLCVIFNIFYSAKGNLKAVKWIDLLLSLLSWLMVLLFIITCVREVILGFPDYGKDLEEYESKNK